LDFVSHLLMLHGFHPALDEGAGNAVYWTLAREEYLYLMYAGALLYLRRAAGPGKSLLTVFTVGAISYLISAAIVPADSPWRRIVDYSPLFLWIQWALGMIAVEAHYGIVRLPACCYWLTLVPVWFIVGILAREYLPVLAPAAWGMTFFTLLNYCVRREEAGKWPNSFPFRWLFSIGIFSYSLYLVHTVAIAGTDRITRGRPSLSPLMTLLGALGLVLISILAGRIYYGMVEKHFLNSSPKDQP
jgi:peptidoglycan/LPS O-acetylase OafA/YrhL